jgi:hypothetical protein
MIAAAVHPAAAVSASIRNGLMNMLVGKAHMRFPPIDVATRVVILRRSCHCERGEAIGGPAVRSAP